MSSPDLLNQLHQEGLTAHQLRLTFVDRSVGITAWKEGEELDSGIWEKQLNPFISLRKSEIRQAYRSTPEDYQDTLIEAETALDAVDDAERPAMDALIDGQYIGLGYTSHTELTVTAIPQRHWHFLSVEFDEGSATGNDFQYKGIRFIESEKLNTDQMLAIKGSLAQMDTTESDAQDSESFEALGAKLWSDITLRLLKNNFVEVGGPAKKIKVSLDWLELMNKTEGIPNVVFELLLKMAKGRKVSSKQKHLVSRLRRTLEEKFSLPGDPIHFEEQGGYVPNFKIVDDRNAADERAKTEAVFTPYDDNIDYVGEAKDLESSSDSDELENQDDYDKNYEDQNDLAGKYLREHDR